MMIVPQQNSLEVIFWTSPFGCLSRRDYLRGYQSGESQQSASQIVACSKDEGYREIGKFQKRDGQTEVRS